MAKRTDRNQQEIIDALRAIGATVQSLHVVGRGCPDLLIGYHGKNHLLEIKDWTLEPRKRRLNPAEQLWHETWRGQVTKVETIDEAYAAIGAHLAGRPVRQ